MCNLSSFSQYVRGLKNFRAEQPHQHAIYYTNMLVAEQQWTKEELLDATDGQSSIWTIIEIYLASVMEVCLSTLCCWELEKQLFLPVINRGTKGHQDDDLWRNICNINSVFYVYMLKFVMYSLISDMTIEKLKTFIPQLFSQLYLEALAYGNITREVLFGFYIKLYYHSRHIFRYSLFTQ